MPRLSSHPVINARKLLPAVVVGLFWEANTESAHRWVNADTGQDSLSAHRQFGDRVAVIAGGDGYNNSAREACMPER